MANVHVAAGWPCRGGFLSAIHGSFPSLPFVPILIMHVDDARPSAGLDDAVHWLAPSSSAVGSCRSRPGPKARQVGNDLCSFLSLSTPHTHTHLSISRASLYFFVSSPPFFCASSLALQAKRGLQKNNALATSHGFFFCPLSLAL